MSISVFDLLRVGIPFLLTYLTVADDLYSPE